MGNTWVMVADGARARLFELGEDEGAWQELACFVNEEGRRPHASRELPRTQESVGRARHVIEPHTSERDKRLGHFADELVAALEQGHSEQRFQRLMIVAAPRFLGMLHGRLGKPLKACLAGEVRHNLTTLHSEEIRRQLPPQRMA